MELTSALGPASGVTFRVTLELVLVVYHNKVVVTTSVNEPAVVTSVSGTKVNLPAEMSVAEMIWFSVTGTPPKYSVPVVGSEVTVTLDSVPDVKSEALKT